MSSFDRRRVPGPGPLRPMSFPEIERAELENGLGVINARHGDLPLVTAEIVIGYGAASDPAGKAGLAYLTANALETGTRERDADQIARALESLGVELDTAITWDATLVRITVPRDRLEEAFRLLAEVVRYPSFPTGEVERLRNQQLGAIMQRGTDPGALADDMAIHSIFADGVPYARPLIGTSTTVGGLIEDDLTAFHLRHYIPNQSSALFVGDIELEVARRLAEEYLGDWTSAPAIEVEFEARGRVDETKIFLVDRPGSVQSEIRIGDIGVARRDPDYFPLLVMNTILGGAFTSRLNINLREKQGFTYGVRSGFAFRKEPGPFLIETAVATEVTAPALEEAYRELVLLREEGAREEEVSAAKDFLRGIMPLQLQTTGRLASRLADIIVYDLPDDYFEHYRDQIAAVGPEEVHRVAQKHLRPERLAITIVGEAGAITEPLAELEIGSIEMLDAGENR